MDAKQKKQIQVALARSVASRDVSDSDVAAFVDRLDLKEKVRGIDICTHGICWDFFLERPEIEGLIRGAAPAGSIGEIRVFPHGMFPETDLFHVQMEQDVPEFRDASRR